MWVIAKFFDENTVEAVPEKWFTAATTCCWPPYSGNRLKKAILTCEEPQSNWQPNKARLLTKIPLENYNEALEKAIMAQSTSDVETPNVLPHKRRITKNKRYENDSTSSNSNNDGEESDLEDFPDYHKSNKSEKNIKKGSVVQQKGCKSLNNIKPLDQKPSDTGLASHLSRVRDSELRELSSMPDSNPRDYMATKDCQLDIGTNYRRRSLSADSTPIGCIESFTSNTDQDMFLDLSDSTLRSQGHQDCKNCGKQKWKKNIYLLNNLDTKVEELTVTLNIIKRNMPRQEKKQAVSLPEIYSNFPLQTAEKLDELEKFLQIEDNMVNFVNYLASVGGDTSYEIIKRCMSRTLSNQVAMSYNWEGIRNKKNFQVLRMCKALQEAVLKNLHNPTEKQTEKDIKTWLKHAKERFEKSQKN
ncbi:unnamed protein product [Brassicogethes aeneus]|uniref:DUF4806 domain-containing protein n=1 Tax=Brassicogethes aeneus TaxID=1431903 RepID=A0A9P0FG78_BRAAE|nr:unnamed protein product [Brassicogethes aeneus]